MGLLYFMQYHKMFCLPCGHTWNLKEIDREKICDECERPLITLDEKMKIEKCIWIYPDIMFDTINETITLTYSYDYHFDVNSLVRSQPNIIHHLCEKNWFPEEGFFNLIEFGRKRFPEFNFDRIIFDCGQEFKMREVWENFDRYKMLADFADKITIKT